MFSWFSITGRIIAFLEGTVSPRSIARGVCLALFLGFVPLAGPMGFLLGLVFFIFTFNRISTVIALPFFKLLYLAGLWRICETLGDYLLIRATFLTGFWEWFLSLPLFALLDLNNTLVTGGVALACIASIPMYWASKIIAGHIHARYAKPLAASRFGRWIQRFKSVNKIVSRAEKISKYVP